MGEAAVKLKGQLPAKEAKSNAKAPAVWADRGFHVMEGDYIIKA